MSHKCRETAGTLAVLLNWWRLPLWGTLQRLRHSWLSQLRRGAPWHYRQWAMDAEHHKMQRRANPHFVKKNHPAQSANRNAEVQKPCSKRRQRKEGYRGPPLSQAYYSEDAYKKKGNSLTCSTNCCSNSIIRGVKFLRLSEES